MDFAALGQLTVLSGCVCPGRELRLECTVVGGFATEWRGTAFDCPEQFDVIDLLHSGFESGTTLECNNGIITGHGHNRTFDGLSSTYTSQLTVSLPSLNATFNNTLDGKAVECAHNVGLPDNMLVGAYTIAYSTDGMYFEFNYMAHALNLAQS